MDILEAIKSDHDRVKALWKEAQSEQVEQKLLQYYQIIRNELLLHGDLEESIFYPAFKKYPELSELIQHSYEDHAKIKTALAEIEKLAKDNQHLDYLDNRFESLMEDVDHHVQEEETKVFPLVRKIMKSRERDVLGRHFLAGKQERIAA